MSAGNLLNHILYKDGYLEKLITENYESIYKYCCYHLNQRQAAEDLTQEVFLKFLNNLDHYRDHGKIKNYLYVIAGNLIRNYYKTLGIMAVTLWMSSIFKNAYGVIVVAFLLLIVPSFLQAGFSGYLLQHILALLPSNIMGFTFKDYTAYAVGGKMISCLSMDLIVNGAAAVIFSAAGYGIFRKHQVNK